MFSIFSRPKLPKDLKGGTVYDYRLGRRFDPGAPAEAFEALLGTPVFLFRGAARLAGSMSKFQPPQVWFRNQTGVQGLGGLQAGQFVGAPLIDPSQVNNEGG
jgi:hypothetical protein